MLERFAWGFFANDDASVGSAAIGCGPFWVRWQPPMRPARVGSVCIGRSPLAGIRCEVAAPSKLTRPAGDRVKTDAKDALLLAQLLRVGQITAVRVPTVTEEAARDLV